MPVAAESPAEPEANTKEAPSFWDSWTGLIFLIAAILLGRFYVLEPFKIPSGSMEPTLIGHEDYGDRIVTNKLAYVKPTVVYATLAISAVLIIAGIALSKAWQRRRSIVTWALITIGVLGGIGFAFVDGAVAGEPTRFEVVVFKYDEEWAAPDRPSKKINYIKRLVGLPGDTLVVSGGDLFLRTGGDNKIIRKYEQAPQTQERLWFPVSKAWANYGHEGPVLDDPNAAAIEKQLDALAFPWNGAETAGAARDAKGLALDGSALITLTYRHPVTNLYVKQGRWPFKHNNCPAAKSPEGSKVRHPNTKTELISAFIDEAWQGVQCPNCRQVQFPIDSKISSHPLNSITPEARGSSFRGGDVVANDLRLDLEITVESFGGMQLQVGSDLHSALWTIGSDAGLPRVQPGSNVHAVSKSTPALSPGKHKLSLAYVDGTVLATLDGELIDKVDVAAEPPGTAARKNQTVLRVSFGGVKGRVQKLDVYRDLYYLATVNLSPRQHTMQPSIRFLEDEGWTHVTRIPQDHFLMFGDNSPSSSDGRMWGTVPREELVGRASFVWWPPSRWRLIK